mmetsp:Transcript_29205/g.67010  ORF Transcript_29205/g.67010 Transcript_29205/m.67010 type:complete len:331 (-) Transcript_29205:338-1330(-)
MQTDKDSFPVITKNSTEEERQRDLISHFILRIAYCQTEEHRRWFLTNECQLFGMRFKSLTPSESDAFFKEHGLKYPRLERSEKERLRFKLLTLSGNMSGSQYDAMEYYKVPFTEILNLVGRREVYIEAGSAYVPRTKVISIIEGQFRTSLSRSLTLAYQNISILDRDNRIGPLVKTLAKVAFRYGSASQVIDGQHTDAESVVPIFCDYLATQMGHTEPKKRPCGINKLFVNVGTRKANEQDKTCPIAGRVHKSNTQKYTIYLDTKVMMQGCWDAVCQATNRHVFYQICDGKCVRVGWEPPPVLRSEPSTNDIQSKNGKASFLKGSKAIVT